MTSEWERFQNDSENHSAAAERVLNNECPGFGILTCAERTKPNNGHGTYPIHADIRYVPTGKKRGKTLSLCLHCTHQWMHVAYSAGTTAKVEIRFIRLNGTPFQE